MFRRLFVATPAEVNERRAQCTTTSVFFVLGTVAFVYNAMRYSQNIIDELEETDD